MADRFRDWTTIVYPDSANFEDWIKILKENHLCFLVSPLHMADPDGDPDEFKPHWHLYLKFEGVKTYDQVCELCNFSHAKIMKVSNPSGLVRYFFHADDPDKPQYDVDQAYMYGGFERYVTDAFGLTKEEANEIMCEIQDWITEYQIFEYETLWKHSLDIPKWRYVLNMYSCMSINRLITSIRGKKTAKEKACEKS